MAIVISIPRAELRCPWELLVNENSWVTCSKLYTWAAHSSAGEFFKHGTQDSSQFRISQRQGKEAPVRIIVALFHICVPYSALLCSRVQNMKQPVGMTVPEIIPFFFNPPFQFLFLCIPLSLIPSLRLSVSTLVMGFCVTLYWYACLPSFNWIKLLHDGAQKPHTITIQRSRDVTRH